MVFVIFFRLSWRQDLLGGKAGIRESDKAIAGIWPPVALVASHGFQGCFIFHRLKVPR